MTAGSPAGLPAARTPVTRVSAWLQTLEHGLVTEGVDEAEACVALAWAAGQTIDIDAEERRGTLRRAVLLLASGGDPRRLPDLDERAAVAVAEDLDRPERRASLSSGLSGLRDSAALLPHVLRLLEDLLADGDLSWRLFALSLLAEELEE